MKTDRLIAITMYLLNRETVSAAALAEKFEVSKRTIQRDIDALNRAGIPIVSAYGTTGGYSIFDTFRPAKQLTNADDYLHIITALKGLTTAYESDRLNATLEKALAATQGRKQHIFIDFSVAREGMLVNAHLRTIEEAIVNKTLLSINYTSADGVCTERTVEPLALSFQWCTWYVFAYCQTRQGYRLFKLPRITHCEQVAGTFSQNHSDAETLMNRDSTSDTRKHYRVRLLCKKAARQPVLEYLGTNITMEHENGDFELLLPDVPLERMWFSLLLGFGNQVEVLEPAELKTLLAARAKEILSVYEMATY